MNTTLVEAIPAVAQREVQPPCQAACPAGIRARDYIALIAQSRYQDAISLIRERMPFTSACGRICRYPCEAECNRGLVDEPVAIMYLKRFASDYAYHAQFPYPDPVPKTRMEKIAIVGAGPCGLTAAQDLTTLGYAVTVFDALPFLGGTLRAALPHYRLPQKLLDWDIGNILALGIEFNTNTTLGKSFSLGELQEEGYNAILIATGVERSRKLSRPDAGIFAEGDLAFNTMWTVDAVAAGHKAATSIHSYLQGESATPFIASPARVAKREKAELEKRVHDGQIKLKPRAAMLLWEPLKGVDDLVEMDLGYTEEAALQEAQRCLGCGAAEIIEEKCAACLTCVRVCPYEVPIITPLRTVEIRSERCQACGVCVGECPVRAISFTMPGVEDIVLQVEATLKGKPSSETEPRIIVFCCSYRAYPEIDFLESMKASFPKAGIIPLICVTKVDTLHLLKAFELGADGVFIVGCNEEDCAYEKGIFWAKRRLDSAKKILTEIGLGSERAEMYNLSTSEMPEFRQALAEFIQRIEQLGPSPLKR